MSSEREQELRRLLSEAVEPVEPAPGAQTRLFARARAQAHRRKSRKPLIVRWAVPLTFAAVIVFFAVTVTFALRHGQGSEASKSGGTDAAGAPSRAAESSPASALAPAAPSATPGPLQYKPVPRAPSSQDLSSLQNGSGGSTYGKSANAQAGATGTARPSLDFLPDLDGDGAPDSVSLADSTLTATLSRDGVQTVSLPPPVGSGSGVLGATTLSDPSGKPVIVVFVRLTQAGPDATDTLVSVVGGRLTVLRQGSEPALLTIDPTHGYACDQRALVLAGNMTPYVVSGAQLVPPPQQRGVITPAGKVLGCY